MKRIGCVLLVVAMMIGFCGCGNNEKEEGWNDKDFMFYNQRGKVVMQPEEGPAGKSMIWLSDAEEGALTYRDVKIGDDAVSALKKYDWTDGIYAIYKEGTSSYDDELNAQYETIAPTVDEFIQYITENNIDDLKFDIQLTLYKQDGKLCTSSALTEDTVAATSHKLKYIFAFTVEDMKVKDISIHNNYCFLSYAVKSTNHGVVPDTDQYDWLRELGD